MPRSSARSATSVGTGAPPSETAAILARCSMTWSRKSGRWVPTRAGALFEVLFRLYGPQKPVFDKVWKLPDIEPAP